MLPVTITSASLLTANSEKAALISTFVSKTTRGLLFIQNLSEDVIGEAAFSGCAAHVIHDAS